MLIFVFDVESEGAALETDMSNYKECIKYLNIYSKNANIFILIHKMDKIKDSEKQIIFDNKKQGNILKRHHFRERGNEYKRSFWHFYLGWNTL